MQPPIFNSPAASSRISRSGWLLIVQIVAVASASLVAAAAAGVLFVGSPTAQPLLAPAAVLLAASGLAQLFIVLRAHREHRLETLAKHICSASFLRRLLVLAALVYFVALVFGPRPNLVWVYAATVSAMYGVLLLPLAAPPCVLDIWREWSQSRFGRRLNWLVPATLVLAVVAEVGLQAHRLADQRGWMAAVKQTPREDAAPAVADVDSDFQYIMATEQIRSGPFRMAVATSLDPAEIEQGGYLTRVRQMFPGLETQCLRVAPSWTCRTAIDLAAQAVAVDADLLVVVLPACELVTRPSVSRDWFDWRQLELAHLVGIASAAQPSVEQVHPSVDSNNFEAHLARLAPQLTACRSPLSEAMHGRWQQAHAALDTLADRCRANQLPLALVLVPAEFQVNSALGETVARRSGCERHQLDLELPQRKWAAYAESRSLPLVDLLPTLRLCRDGAYDRNSATWNASGNAAAASSIGGWLESRYGGQLSVAAQLTSSK